MYDYVGLKICCNRRKKFVVLEHAFGCGKIGVLQKYLMVFLLQRDIIVVGHAIKTVDAEPFVKQELCEVETDEAGGAGDEDFSHGGVQYGI